jgi:hypothetical protein
MDSSISKKKTTIFQDNCKNRNQKQILPSRKTLDRDSSVPTVFTTVNALRLVFYAMVSGSDECDGV